MNWSEILTTSVVTTALMGALTCVLTYVLREWITIRLRESVSAEYRQALEFFKQKLVWEDKRRQQAAEVAELFSLWLQSNYDKAKDENIGRYELQKKY